MCYIRILHLFSTYNPTHGPQVVQPFDASKFNFAKASVSEVLFSFEPAAAGGGAAFDPAAKQTASPNALLINV